MSGSSSQPDRELRLDEAVAAYLEAVERGERPDRGAWLARYPDLAPELAEFIDDQNRVQGWTSPIRNVHSGVLPGGPGNPRAGGSPLAAGDPLATLHVTSGAIAEARGRFPNYELLDEIARGGMGIVYRARQLNPSRIVALKMILAGPRATEAELYRFRMETEAAASLDHPHIMPIYEVSEQNGRPFFSMKLMEGGTLAEHLPRFAGDGRAAAELLIKVARAVHHAHLRGILHRDLKPANILLDAQGEPFVTDFGLCRRVEVDSGMTQSGVIVGTPSYMSPEQAAGRKGLTTATDVYSLGAVFYALLTDRPPFRGNTPLETVRGVLEDEPSRPRVLRPQVDRDLETICLKCLDKQPERRYRSAEAVADDLERWLAGEPIVARRTSVWERTWKRARRNPTAAALVAVSSLALVFLIAAGLIYQNNRATVAEQALASANEMLRKRSEASGNIGQADALLRKGDAQGARLHANLAIVEAKGEPELQELATQAQDLLAKAEQQLNRERDQEAATARFHQFQASHDDFLSLYASVDASAFELTLVRTGESAMGAIGLSRDGEGVPWRISDLSASQQAAMKEGSYELLLVMAEVAARENPPNWKRALRLATRAAEFGAPTSTYHARRARYLSQLGQEQDAILESKLASNGPSKNALDHFLRGNEARRQGDFPVAIGELRDAIRIQPGHIWAQFCLAACMLATDPRESEVHATNILQDRPELGLAYLLRANANTALGEFELALSDFERALGHDELRYSALVNRGELFTRHKRYEQAEADLLQAISLRPELHSAHLNLALTYERQGRAKDAAEQLERALAAKDLTPPVEAAILLYRAINPTLEPAAAFEDLHQSLKVYPYAEAYVELAETRLRQKELTNNDYDAVVEWCDYALASGAYSPKTYPITRTHYLRAHALVALARYDDAADTLDRYLAAGGRPSSEIQRLRGIIRVQHKDFPAAIGFLSEALALDEGNSETLAERGNVYLAIGALDLAAADFRSALMKDPKNAHALAGRGLIRAMRGNDGAEEDAERAWAAGPQTPRLAWMAARTLAIVHGRLQMRGRFVSVEESKNMVRYRQRAAALFEQALLRTPEAQWPTYWQTAIESDPAFSHLRDQPAFQALKRKYAPEVKPAPAL